MFSRSPTSFQFPGCFHSSPGNSGKWNCVFHINWAYHKIKIDRYFIHPLREILYSLNSMFVYNNFWFENPHIRHLLTYNFNLGIQLVACTWKNGCSVSLRLPTLTGCILSATWLFLRSASVLVTTISIRLHRLFSSTWMAHPDVQSQEGLLCLSAQSQERGGDTRRLAVTQAKLDRAIEGHKPSSRTDIFYCVEGEARVVWQSPTKWPRTGYWCACFDQTVRFDEGGKRA